MNRGDAVGRASGRSSLLGHPNAKFSDENGRELRKLRKREKPRLAGPPRLSALRIDELTWGARGGDMSRAHSAGSRNRKSGPCQRASQVVHRVAMMAREIWASQANDSFHLSRRYVHGEQFSSEPQIDDAPVNLGKTFLNMPTLHPGSINTRGSLRRHGVFIAAVQARIDPVRRQRWGLLCDGLHGRTQQILGGTGQDRTSFDDFDPRSRTGGSTAFLISEACQSSQVAPVGAGQVASVGVSQLFTDDRGYARLQGRDADANPSLEMARASLEHHARLVATSSHKRQHIGSGVIQVEENIAGVAILSEGEKINVKALKIACAQEAQHRSPRQLPNIPHSFTWARTSCGAMDQADEIEIIRHGRKLATDCVQSEEESAIGHGPENATEAPRAYNDFSANGNNPLNSVSQLRGAPHGF
jgi:hypothetical protein